MEFFGIGLDPPRALRDAYFNFRDEFENLHHWFSCFETRAFSLILWEENKNYPTQFRASRRDWEIKSLYLEIRYEIQKIFLSFSRYVQGDPKKRTQMCFTVVLLDIVWSYIV